MQGFTPDGGFVIGNTCLWPHLDPHRVLFDARGNRVGGGFGTAGTAPEWSAAAEMLLAKGYETYAFTMLASLGAPLQATFKDAGLIVAIHFPGRTGRGTLQKALTSPWGDQNCLTLRQEEPLEERVKTAREYATLPTFYEDLLRLDPYTRSKFIPQVLEQSRLLFCCNTESATEEDKVLVLNHKTRRRFVLELTAKVKGKDLLDEDRISILLSKHYGHAALRFYQYVVKNQQVVAAMLRQVEERCYEDVKRGNMDMRPYSALLAVVSVTAMIAGKLGLLPITPERLVGWLLDRIQENHTGRPAHMKDVEDILTAFLLEQDHHLALLSGEDEGGRSYMVPYLEPRPTENVRVRYEYQRNRLIIEAKYFKEWLSDHGHKYLATRHLLLQRQIIARDNLMYDLHTRMQGRSKYRETCLVLDARTPACQTAIQAWARRHDVPLPPHQGFPRFASLSERAQARREKLTGALAGLRPGSSSLPPAASPDSTETSSPSAPLGA